MNVHPERVSGDGGGAHAVRAFSADAERIDLCLFEPCDPGRQTACIPMTRRGAWEWIAELATAQAGLLYGFRASGPWDPRRGQVFNPQKLLLDPLAPAIAGDVRWDDAVFGYHAEEGGRDGHADPRDSAAFVPRGLIVDESFDWGGDRPPRTPWRDTILYECHVKGATMLHPDVPQRDRGRYLGLASEAFLDHVLSLGVTALELMPVQACVTRRWLINKGLTNYWGYDPVSFVAPDARFATGDRGEQVIEFKRMVKAIHARGLEVILDVVFNHTVEGDETGPTLSLRGLDHRAYYRLDGEGRCIDRTGCGNTVNTDHPLTRRLIIEAMRTWVTRMHVDGFRLDLAATLGRRGPSAQAGDGAFDPEHPLLVEMRDDPVLSRVKIIAEPWDTRPDGYALGRFPKCWPEWNDRFRDRVRRFWRGDAGQIGAIASAVAGSSDLITDKGGPAGSINFVACHDGFTLRDLTMYERRHNEANGEHGRDGHDANFSRNWGVEGPTDDPRILHLRERAQRNLLATVALSCGVPMISAGDELGRTQQGNNNAYCQDNVISWVRWPSGAVGLRETHDRDGARKRTGAEGEPPRHIGGAGGNADGARFLRFARRVLALRRSLGVFRVERFLTGTAQCACGVEDVSWWSPEGARMTHEMWHDAERRALLMLRHAHGGDGPAGETPSGGGHTVAWLMNAGDATVWFRLPGLSIPGQWVRVLSTLGDETARKTLRSARLRVPSYSCVIVRLSRTDA